MQKLIYIILFIITNLNIANAFETKAKYAILIDSESKEILFEKDANIATPPSSMSKLMTLYMVFDSLRNGSLSLDTKFTVSKEAWKKAGSKMFIHVNDQVSVEDLIKGISVSSGNDACITIAEGIAGSEDNFANMMNEKAKELKLENSQFKNSTGWPENGHVMSAKDIATLSLALINDFPEYYHYFNIKEFTYNNIRQENRNMLLSKSHLGVDGLKTGHTDIAGYGIATSAKKDDRRLILVVNGLSSTIERANESEKLLQYGFLNFNKINLFKSGEIIDLIDVFMGQDKIAPITIADDISVLLPKYNKKDINVSISYDSPIVAPINAGQIVGEIKIEMPGKESLIYDLIISNNVKKISLIRKILSNMFYKLKLN